MNAVRPDEFPPGELALLPTRRVVWGSGSLDRLENLLDGLRAERVLVMTSRSLAQQGALLARVRSQCGVLYAGHFAAVAAHVPQTAVENAAAAARAVRADTLVCFGGGSVIDAGKAVAARMAQESRRPPAKLIALPTTLSGAEFADHYGVTEAREGGSVKRTHAREDVTPAAVVLDAELTTATGQWLWAGSALKALDHAIEGLMCSVARPVLDELAQAGIHQLVAALPTSLNPAALDARQACQIAAWYCYFAPASLTLGLSHRIGHVLGGTYGVPHAFTSGLTLPAVLAATAPTVPRRFDLVTQALEPVAMHFGDERRARDAGAVLSRLADEAGLPTCLRDVEVARRDLKAIAEQVVTLYPEAIHQLNGSGLQLIDLLESIW
ncbi:iron-containing alcohol dehydrogenase [Streptomyces sp. NBC_00882]|uniref:iron-containing alcohol dehydrogenase n=1 Tax=Streptomyces TaxID=1883 RepID=UPI0038657D74|nr:iron-containing alcohol dehydrogenase [Streptomyces sp. NBC_00882]WSZ56255.1 iron-containing alcohol dehydrogenase [Streptomyces canus]